MKPLFPSQQEALRQANQKANLHSERLLEELNTLLVKYQISENLLHTTINEISQSGSVLIHFHPDRLDKNGKTVLDSLLDSGFYQNQFETGISNGGLTAFRGGERDNWEKKLFGGSYQQENCQPIERPKYGALDLLGFPNGASPRFGSCYFRLKSNILPYCTFTYRDSYFEPDTIATSQVLLPIIFEAFQEWKESKTILGKPFSSPKIFLDFIKEKPSISAFGKQIDDYIEVQIHASISLVTNVDSLVLDASFRGTECEQKALQLFEQFNIRLEWHMGYVLDKARIPAVFRDGAAPEIANLVNNEVSVNPYQIGRFAQSVVTGPNKWKDRMGDKDLLQSIKYLWHAMVLFGRENQF